MINLVLLESKVGRHKWTEVFCPTKEFLQLFREGINLCPNARSSLITTITAIQAESKSISISIYCDQSRPSPIHQSQSLSISISVPISIIVNPHHLTLKMASLPTDDDTVSWPLISLPSLPLPTLPVDPLAV